MPDLLDHLKNALGDRYRVDREIGRGGMAHVLLTHDRKLDRPVASRCCGRARLTPLPGVAMPSIRFLGGRPTTRARRRE
jgi:hypothetical protein